jgi:hypothetical protein
MRSPVASSIYDPPCSCNMIGPSGRHPHREIAARVGLRTPSCPPLAPLLMANALTVARSRALGRGSTDGPLGPTSWRHVPPPAAGNKGGGRQGTEGNGRKQSEWFGHESVHRNSRSQAALPQARQLKRPIR